MHRQNRLQNYELVSLYLKMLHTVLINKPVNIFFKGKQVLLTNGSNN